MAFSEQRGDNYVIRCNCGKDSQGKRIVRSMTWTPPKGLTPRQLERELDRVKAEFQAECDSKNFVDRSVTFEKYAAEWKLHAENNLKPTTFNRYCSLLERIIPAIGKKKLWEIKPCDLYTFYDNLRAVVLCHSETRPELAKHLGISATTVDCIRAKKNISIDTADKFSGYFGKKTKALFDIQERTISDQTILHHHRLISTILQSAVYDGKIDFNPCSCTKPPKVAGKEARYLNDSEAQLLLDTVSAKAPHPYDVIVFVLLLTGMRRGECCALNWEDIDFQKKTIHICRSLSYISKKGIFETDPKTFSSNRIIRVDDDLLDILKEHKKRQEQTAEKLGSKWRQSFHSRRREDYQSRYCFIMVLRFCIGQ